MDNPYHLQPNPAQGNVQSQSPLPPHLCPPPLPELVSAPKSAKVFGSLNIVLGAFDLLGWLSLLAAFKHSDSPFHGLTGLDPRTEIIATIVISFPLAGMLIASGIGLLRNQTWGRMLGIGYSAAVIGYGAVFIILFYVYVLQPMYDAGVNDGLSDVSNLPKIAAANMVVVLQVLGMVYPSILLFFMMRRNFARSFGKASP